MQHPTAHLRGSEPPHRLHLLLSITSQEYRRVLVHQGITPSIRSDLSGSTHFLKAHHQSSWGLFPFNHSKGTHNCLQFLFPLTFSYISWLKYNSDSTGFSSEWIFCSYGTGTFSESLSSKVVPAACTMVQTDHLQCSPEQVTSSHLYKEKWEVA